MMRSWIGSLRVSPREASLLVEDEDEGDLLKARLPMPPRHPRALLTMLEGIALWRGQPMRVVLSACEASIPWLDSGLFGDDLWPGESQLVRFAVAAPGSRKLITGLGDYRAQRRRGVP